MRFVRFSYYKTANRTAPCGVVRCGAIMPFCERFWCGFCGLCGLCGLVNTPSWTSKTLNLSLLWFNERSGSKNLGVWCSILCVREPKGIFGAWVLWECYCTTIVFSLFYNKTFSIATCGCWHIAEPYKFLVFIFLLCFFFFLKTFSSLFFNLAFSGRIFITYLKFANKLIYLWIQVTSFFFFFEKQIHTHKGKGNGF